LPDPTPNSYAKPAPPKDTPSYNAYGQKVPKDTPIPNSYSKTVPLPDPTPNSYAKPAPPKDTPSYNAYGQKVPKDPPTPNSYSKTVPLPDPVPNAYGQPVPLPDPVPNAYGAKKQDPPAPNAYGARKPADPPTPNAYGAKKPAPVPVPKDAPVPASKPHGGKKPIAPVNPVAPVNPIIPSEDIISPPQTCSRGATWTDVVGCYECEMRKSAELCHSELPASFDLCANKTAIFRLSSLFSDCLRDKPPTCHKLNENMAFAFLLATYDSDVVDLNRRNECLFQRARDPIMQCMSQCDELKDPDTIDSEPIVECYNELQGQISTMLHDFADCIRSNEHH
jgi:hypothetical protein